MTNVYLTAPTGMTLQDWAAQVCLDLDAAGPIGRLQDETQWQDWAVQLFNLNTLGSNLPSPYGFTKWQDWAERLCASLS
jgi:hypothetical protein